MKSAMPERALSIQYLLYASAVPAVFLVLATVLKPLWRDEYWSLFYSSADMTLTDLATEVHPPFYYVFLSTWRTLLDSDLGVRLLSFPILAAGGFAIWKLIADKREAAIFLLLSLGSYWVIYFASEVRPYLLMYAFSAITVCLAIRLVESPVKWGAIALLGVTGALLSLTHYFGALWYCLLCASLGLYFLISKKSTARFSLMAGVGLLAVLPCLVWITLNMQAFDMSSQASGRPFLAELEYAANQFLRGLLAKLVGSNPLALIVGLAGFYAAMKFRDPAMGVLAWAVIGTVVFAFLIHFTFVTMIKERAFVVIMPALIFLASRQIARIEPGTGWRSGFLKYAPIAAIIMPFLFIPEYFKDRERMGELTAVLSEYEAICTGAPLLVYNRPSHHSRYAVMVNERVLGEKGAGFALTEVSPETGTRLAQASECPVKAAALILERGGGESYEEAMVSFQRGGLDTEALEQKTFGKRRNLLLVEPQD